ncbi:serine O-acetyltransferase [Corallibacter sp.]|uniref:serine O-acetyltransferase n=1 Tax=Corallibacter sp. TaxID=2038084 RepID=UPI003AB1B416
MKRISIGRAIYCFLKDSVLSVYCYRNIKVYLCNHLNIGIWELYKKKTILPHPFGIVIGYKVKIGKECKIYHNVTIGTKETQDFKNGRYPKIGNKVIIYPNSVVIGNIKIGDNVIIGAGSIVLNDIPSNSIVKGNPAKIVKTRKNE